MNLTPGNWIAIGGILVTISGFIYNLMKRSVKNEVQTQANTEDIETLQDDVKQNQRFTNDEIKELRKDSNEKLSDIQRQLGELPLKIIEIIKDK